MANLTSTIKLALDSTAAKKGIAKMKARFRDMGKTLANGFKLAAKAGAALFVGLTAATVLYAKKFATEMDRIGKLSKRFGETAESMQRIQEAAKLGGTDLEVVAKGVQNLVRGLIEAEQGSSTYADAVKELGLNAATLIDMPMEQQLLAISRAYRDAGGSARALAAMQDLLGRAGPELAALVAEGPEALAKAFDETEVVSGRVVKSMELVNDTITKMSNIIRASFGTAIESIAPLIDEKLPLFVERFREFGKTAGQVMGMALRGNYEPILLALDVFARRAGEIISATIKFAVSESLDEFLPAIQERFNNIQFGFMSKEARGAITSATTKTLKGMSSKKTFGEFQEEAKGTILTPEIMAEFKEMNKSLGVIEETTKENAEWQRRLDLLEERYRQGGY